MYKITPAMGWNTWNTFGEHVNEEVLLRSADRMANSPLRAAGYEYIVLDDCWSLMRRDVEGRLVADPEKFPHGMKYVADYIHSLGLKFGMYSCAGTVTCAGYPASYDHEFTDARTFAEWGVDYLKYDYCFSNVGLPGHLLYKRMGLALANCGRDILFSACSWGADDTRVWIKETGAHSWRSTADITDCWSSIRALISRELQHMEYNGQGCFNDMDMLVVGMNGKGNVGQGGCTEEEYYTHFAFWCFFGSPLMLGSDITEMDERTMAMVTNPSLIRINQDKKQNQPYFLTRMKKNTALSPENPEYYDQYPALPLMARLLDDGRIAIGLFNLTDGTSNRWNGTVNTAALGLPLSSGKRLRLTDVRDGSVILSENECFTIPDTAPHASRVYIAEVVE